MSYHLVLNLIRNIASQTKFSTGMGHEAFKEEAIIQDAQESWHLRLNNYQEGDP